MDKKVFLNYESVLQFSNALELLNESINEFNNVAEKMVPEKLIHDGFLNYLRVFCKSLEENSNVKFIYKSKITELPAGEESEIILFRVMRSILLLLLKNSQPVFIHIDLFIKEETLRIDIEDDGINIFRQPLFMVSQTINNVTALLQTLEGKLLTDSATIAGNSIKIEVQL